MALQQAWEKTGIVWSVCVSVRDSWLGSLVLQ